MNKITVKANAKINLALYVKDKRKDGFHEIESIFQEVDFGDQLSIEKADEISFKTNLKELSNQPSNICIDAAELLRKNYKIPGLKINLNKRIPIGAGLGGGSSDAAAVLKAGIHLYKLKIGKEKLLTLAALLGSDVPFFLSGKTAYVYGRGDVLKSIKSSIYYYIILVMPEVNISTSWAYKNLRLGLTKNDCNLKFISLEFCDLNVEDFAHFFHNDFEECVFEVYPQLEKIKCSLYETGADYASLSGSGSTVYGIYRSEDKAQSALKSFGSQYRCVFTTPVLG